MSNSVFLTSNSIPGNSLRASDLVLIYGKDGIQFDQKGLRNAIVNKSACTISVVRFTSEASETTAIEGDSVNAPQEFDESLQLCNYSDSSISGYNSESPSEENNNCKPCDNFSEPSSFDNDALQPTKLPRVVKKNKDSPAVRANPQNVISIEIDNFFTENAASNIVNNALRLAGMSESVGSCSTLQDILRKIKHDHMYTPFTTPEQKRDKIMARKFLERNKHATTTGFTKKISQKRVVNLHRTHKGFQLFPRDCLKVNSSPINAPMYMLLGKRKREAEDDEQTQKCATTILSQELPVPNKKDPTGGITSHRISQPDNVPDNVPDVPDNTSFVNISKYDKIKYPSSNYGALALDIGQNLLEEQPTEISNTEPIQAYTCQTLLSSEVAKSSLVNIGNSKLKSCKKLNRGVFVDLNTLQPPTKNNQVNSSSVRAPNYIYAHKQDGTFALLGGNIKHTDRFVERIKNDPEELGCATNNRSMVDTIEGTDVVQQRTNVEYNMNEDERNINSMEKSLINTDNDDNLINGQNDVTNDFLQHVVGLIEFDQKFKNEVEQQVLGVPLSTFTANQLLLNPQEPIPTNSDNVPFPTLSTGVVPVSSCSASLNAANNGCSQQTRKVLRSNGRIITLPPIEAPTTRAKERAKCSHSRKINAVISSADSSIKSSHAKTQLNMTDCSKRHNSAKEKRVTPAKQDKHDSDDDPDKLWCICKQPHNNRFMICCDLCHDWFHGSCVGVSKFLGREIEQKGTIWKCPLCKKKADEKKQPRINEALQIVSKRKAFASEPEKQPVRLSYKDCKTANDFTHHNNTIKSNGQFRSPDDHKLIGSRQGVETTLTTASFSAIPQAESKETILCLACGKTSPKNNNYCNNDCVRSYALAQKHKFFKDKHGRKDLQKDVPLLLENTTHLEKVPLIDRRNLHILNGCDAPTLQNLETFLLENPTYEVIEITDRQLSEIDNKDPMSPEKCGSAVEIDETSHGFCGSTRLQTVPKRKQRQKKKDEARKGKPNARKTQIEKSLKKTENPAIHKKSTDVMSLNSTDIRSCVRRTLKSMLISRLTDDNQKEFANSFNATDLGNFAEEVEHEMFELFERSTGSKYRSKYRSLKFNISDRKNETLFSKICSRQISAKQLVKMNVEETASQSLRDWRKKETSHQLEMIKKSELEMLSSNKGYVLKTHKGEELFLEESNNFGVDIGLETDVVIKNSTISEQQTSQECSETPVNCQPPDHAHIFKNLQVPSTQHDEHRTLQMQKNRLSTCDDTPKLRKKLRNTNTTLQGSESDHEETVSKKRASSNDVYNSIHKTELDLERPQSCTKIEKSAISPNHCKPSEMQLEHETVSWIETQKCKDPIWCGEVHMHEVILPFRAVMHPITNSQNIGSLLTPKLHNVGRIRPDVVENYIDQIKFSTTKEVVVVAILPETGQPDLEYEKLYEYMIERNRYCVVSCGKMESIRDFYIGPLKTGKCLPRFLQGLEGVAKWQTSSVKPSVLFGIAVLVILKRQGSVQSIHMDKHRRSSNSSQSTNISRVDIDAIIRTPTLLPTQKHRLENSKALLSREFKSARDEQSDHNYNEAEA